jgi:hypothetical protein
VAVAVALAVADSRDEIREVKVETDRVRSERDCSGVRRFWGFFGVWGWQWLGGSGSGWVAVAVVWVAVARL